MCIQSLYPIRNCLCVDITAAPPIIDPLEWTRVTETSSDVVTNQDLRPMTRSLMKSQTLQEYLVGDGTSKSDFVTALINKEKMTDNLTPELNSPPTSLKHLIRMVSR